MLQLYKNKLLFFKFYKNLLKINKIQTQGIKVDFYKKKLLYNNFFLFKSNYLTKSSKNYVLKLFNKKKIYYYYKYNRKKYIINFFKTSLLLKNLNYLNFFRSLNGYYSKKNLKILKKLNIFYYKNKYIYEIVKKKKFNYKLNKIRKKNKNKINIKFKKFFFFRKLWFNIFHKYTLLICFKNLKKIILNLNLLLDDFNLLKKNLLLINLKKIYKLKLRKINKLLKSSNNKFKLKKKIFKTLEKVIKIKLKNIKINKNFINKKYLKKFLIKIKIYLKIFLKYKLNHKQNLFYDGILKKYNKLKKYKKKKKNNKIYLNTTYKDKYFLKKKTNKIYNYITLKQKFKIKNLKKKNFLYIYVNRSKNNLFLTITNNNNKVLIKNSIGLEKIKNFKKILKYAYEEMAKNLILKFIKKYSKKNLKFIIIVNGFYSFHLKKLFYNLNKKKLNYKIIGIKDFSPRIHNGCIKKKKKRK